MLDVTTRSQLGRPAPQQAQLHIHNCSLRNNSAYVDGGAISIAATPVPSPDSAASNPPRFPLSIRLSASIFAGNRAQGSGGALSVLSPTLGAVQVKPWERERSVRRPYGIACGSPSKPHPESTPVSALAHQVLFLFLCRCPCRPRGAISRAMQLEARSLLRETASFQVSGERCSWHRWTSSDPTSPRCHRRLCCGRAPTAPILRQCSA